MTYDRPCTRLGNHLRGCTYGSPSNSSIRHIAHSASFFIAHPFDINIDIGTWLHTGGRCESVASPCRCEIALLSSLRDPRPRPSAVAASGCRAAAPAHGMDSVE